MKNIHSENFRLYGRVLDLNIAEFVDVINARPATAKGHVIYEPSVKEFEALPLFADLSVQTFGEMPVEFGHCSGFNDKLNALEYHRSSEVDIAATDLILMLGRQQDIDYENFSYDTAKVEKFFIPAGTAVELYATTLHYAPCSVDGKEDSAGENKLLFAVNKWLLAHEEGNISDAWIGLRGKNISV